MLKILKKGWLPYGSRVFFIKWDFDLRWQLAVLCNSNIHVLSGSVWHLGRGQRPQATEIKRSSWGKQYKYVQYMSIWIISVVPALTTEINQYQHTKAAYCLLGPPQLSSINISGQPNLHLSNNNKSVKSSSLRKEHFTPESRAPGLCGYGLAPSTGVHAIALFSPHLEAESGQRLWISLDSDKMLCLICDDNRPVSWERESFQTYKVTYRLMQLPT